MSIKKTLLTTTALVLAMANGINDADLTYKNQAKSKGQLTKKQKKARAKNKVSKQTRKKNRK